MRQGWLAIGALGVGLAATTGGVARADTPARIEVRYRAPAGCASSSAFIAQVDAKSPGIAWTAAATGTTKAYVVAIEAAPGGGYHGAVRTLTDAEDRSRRVDGASRCPAPSRCRAAATATRRRRTARGSRSRTGSPRPT